MCGYWINSVQHSKYHGYSCPGSLHHQVISNHDIHYIELVGPSMGKDFEYLCHANEGQCREMLIYYLVPSKKNAWKGLTPVKVGCWFLCSWSVTQDDGSVPVSIGGMCLAWLSSKQPIILNTLSPYWLNTDWEMIALYQYHIRQYLSTAYGVLFHLCLG